MINVRQIHDENVSEGVNFVFGENYVDTLKKGLLHE
jgi:hypothetical protein